MADDEPTPRQPPDPDAAGSRGESAGPSGSSSRILERLVRARREAGRYEVQGELGRGGMGAVYKVWDGDLRRNLAMKVALEGRAEARGSKSDVKLARFLEEAQITGQLDHPGVVPVHEIGIDGEGRVYFTMQLVKGRDLKAIYELVRAGGEGWTRTRALNVLLRVCEALAFAHEKQVVHRDVKPANVMVGRFGEAYVMDWGLAKVLGGTDKHDLRLRAADEAQLSIVRTDRGDSGRAGSSPLMTMDGDVVGTPCYMAPEQARGALEEIGPHTDVYAVGALLYELLGGRAPYMKPGETLSPVDVLNQVMHRAPTPIGEIAHDVPDELVAICEQAMARDPRQRYASMLAMADDLRAFLENRVVQAYETGALAEFRKWVARNRGMAAAAAAAALAVLGGLGAVAWVQSRANDALKLTNQELSDARDELAGTNAELAAAGEQERQATERALEQELEARASSYSANLAAARASLEDGVVWETHRRLELCPEDLRGFEWRRLALEADSSSWSRAVQPEEHRGSLGGPFLDADVDAAGERVAIATAWETVLVVDARSGAQLVEFAHPAAAGNLSFSPDGRHLVTSSATSTSERVLRIFDAGTGAELRSFPAHRATIQDVDVSPDGGRILSAALDRRVRVWDFASGALLLELELDAGVLCAQWSPDGTRFATGDLDHRVRIHDASSGAVLHELAGHALPISDLSFDRSGRFLASGDRPLSLEERGAAVVDVTARIWDVASGRELGVLSGHERGITSVNLLADCGGATGLITTSLDGATRIFDLGSRGARVLHGHEGSILFAVVTPDGGTLLSGANNGVLRGWALSSATGVDLAPHPQAIVGLGEPRAGLLASLSQGTLRVEDARTAEVLQDFRDLPRGGVALACAGLSGRIAVLSRQRGVANPAVPSALSLWDLESGSIFRREFEEPAADVDITSDGRSVAVGFEAGRILVLDTGTGAEQRALSQEGGVSALALHPGGELLIATGPTQALVWSVETGEARPFPEPNLRPLRFVAGGELVAMVDERTVSLWRTADLSRAAVFHGHGDTVVDAVLSPDGARLATACGDGAVRVWDSRRGELLLALDDLDGRPTALAFLADGARLAVGLEDGRVHVYAAERTADGERAFREGLRIRSIAQRVLAPLFEELVEPEEVARRLRADDALDGEVRSAALRVAARVPSTPVQLEEEGWPVVRTPFAARAELEQVAWKARLSAARDPEDADALRLLGMAHYRLGRCEQALAALEHSDELHRRTRRARPEVAAFLAMASHCAGRPERAAEHLERLRGLMSINILRSDRYAMALLAEAEAALAP